MSQGYYGTVNLSPGYTARFFYQHYKLAQLSEIRCDGWLSPFIHIYSNLGYRSKKQQNMRIPKSLRRSQQSLVKGRMQCCRLTNKQHDHNLRLRSHDPVRSIDGGQPWHGNQPAIAEPRCSVLLIFSNQSYQNWPITTKIHTTGVKRRKTYECQARENT